MKVFQFLMAPKASLGHYSTQKCSDSLRGKPQYISCLEELSLKRNQAEASRGSPLTFNPSSHEAEADISLGLRPAWSTERVPRQPKLYRETLCQNLPSTTAPREPGLHTMTEESSCCVQVLQIKTVLNCLKVPEVYQVFNVFNKYQCILCSYRP